MKKELIAFLDTRPEDDESFRRLELNTSMVLRICKADMTSYNGFIWPEKGHVEAPDWDDTEECGNGLHGWFEAQGDADCSDYLNEPDARYLVLEVETDSIIHLDGKCKFPKADVVFVGSRNEAIAYIEKTYPYLRTMPLLFANRTAGDSGVVATGDYGTATAGDYGTAIAGNYGTVKVGYYGTAKAGYYGTATAGKYGTATAGTYGTATADFCGTATVGDFGTATAGFRGTATAGDRGTATVGEYGTATAGKRGTATVGDCGTAKAGDCGTAIAGDRGTAIAGIRGTVKVGSSGIIQIHYFTDRARIAIGYIGEKGLKPNVKYKLDANHNFVEDVS